MHNVSIQKAENLAPAVKSALESLLGRRLEDGEDISVMAFHPHDAPQGRARAQLAQQLRDQMDDMTQRSADAPDQELDEALDEAMRSVRPGYRPLK